MTLICADRKDKSEKSVKICVHQRYLRPIFIGIGAGLPAV